MKIHELYTDKSKWYQGFDAATKKGVHVYHQHRLAVRWCLVGAICKCYLGEKKRDRVGKKIMHALRDQPPDTIVSWNDAPERTFEDVKRLVTRLDI